MTFIAFIISLLILCIACIASFISTFRDRSYLLIVFIPIITLCGSSIYFSYQSVLGYQIETTWEELPDTFTVIYFKSSKDRLTLWLLESKNTRLVSLPLIDPAEEAMEGSRVDMGKGIPVTFRKSKIDGKGKDGDGDGDGTEQGDGEGESGWHYEVESKGTPVPGSKMKQKEKS